MVSHERLLPLDAIKKERGMISLNKHAVPSQYQFSGANQAGAEPLGPMIAGV